MTHPLHFRTKTLIWGRDRDQVKGRVRGRVGVGIEMRIRAGIG